ncbi:MAG: IclR family transcriptional regulator [Streptosporangiaceae bacterium]
MGAGRRSADAPDAARAGADGTKPILVLQKARALLDVFAPDSPELTLPEIRQATGLPASTCTRLVHNLVREGLLERQADRYRVGATVLRWAGPALRALDLVKLLTPLLEGLRDSTGESAAVYRRQGTRRVCVAVAPTRRSVIWQLHVGLTTPLHVGSGGRAILAFDAAAAEAVLAAERESFTPYTVTEADRLRRVLAETRATGVAVSYQELDQDVGGVSAPVFGLGGQVVAALGVAGPAQRFQREQVDGYAPAVLDAAREASRLMGGEFPTTNARHTPEGDPERNVGRQR